MFPPSKEQFSSFLTNNCSGTVYYEARLEGKLLACSVADIMENGISAVYTYFDPCENKRSLGSMMILFLIEEAKRLKLPSVYLGYWIKNSQKMQYKSSYRPLEIQNGDQWLLVP
jgi:arginine-tRNA-protein transferase